MEPEIDNQYPIGRYQEKGFSEEQKQDWLADIRFLPQALESSIHNLNEAQLKTPYRDGGWTVHQLIHHVADSHMNAYIRFKLGFTESVPTIKVYEEKDWANLADVEALPVNVSLTLLFALHQRWIEFLTSLADDDWNKRIYHPEKKKELSLWNLLGLYAWHGRHHVAQINGLREKKKW